MSLRGHIYPKFELSLENKRQSSVNSSADTSYSFEESGIVVIGASTGGTEAIKNVLLGMPDNSPPIVVAQHIPEQFSKAFADRLNSMCGIYVKEAEQGDVLNPGVCYIAPGGKNMSLVEEDGETSVHVTDADVGSNHRPCIDFLFNSVANLSKRAVGVILTGMGSDGARGLLAMRKSGCFTIGQSKETCVVYGMPKVANELGALDKVSDLEDISKEICEHIKILMRAS
ncbi:MAG: CheB methylesterase domain-containing protein [Bdellovibrionales bacterium]